MCSLNKSEIYFRFRQRKYSQPFVSTGSVSSVSSYSTDWGSTLINGPSGPPYAWMPFYIPDLSNHRFWYPSGPGTNAPRIPRDNRIDVGGIHCHVSSKIIRNPESYLSKWLSSWRSKVAGRRQILHFKQKEEQEGKGQNSCLSVGSVCLTEPSWKPIQPLQLHFTDHLRGSGKQRCLSRHTASWGKKTRFLVSEGRMDTG